MVTMLSSSSAELFIIVASIISVIFGLINALLVMRIKIVSSEDEIMALKDDKILFKFREMDKFQKLIANGASIFLW